MEGLTLNKCLINCKITKPYYRGIYSIDTIPKSKVFIKPYFYVINTDISEGDGKHWILIFFPNARTAEIFDSLGQSPFAYHHAFREYLNARPDWMISYNNKRIQSLNSNVCGAHCLFFAYKKCSKKYGLSTLINR